MKNKKNKNTKQNKINSKKHVSNSNVPKTSFISKRYFYIFIIVLMLVFTSILFREKIPFMKNFKIGSSFASEDNKTSLINKTISLEKEIFENESIQKLQSLPPYKIEGKPLYIIFLSISDSKSRANVLQGKGETLKIAWDVAISNAQEFIQENKYNPIWVKVDIVDTVKEVSTEKLENNLKPYYEHFYRKGISFDPLFDLALIESEINGNKIIDYKEDKIDKKRLDSYLVKYKENKLEEVPSNIYEFTTIGYFSDENDVVYELYTDELNYGRRKIEKVDKGLVKDIIVNSTNFLMENLNEDGKFVYGYFPTYDKEIDNYNILRHTGTIWSLVIQYKITGDKSIIPKIDSAIKYLIDDAVVYKDKDTAYILERKADEIKLGGNGVAIVMLTSYMEEFNTDIYTDLVIKLGNGILELQNDKGGYYHVLNYPDYSRKEQYRTVYYDGEATFALAKLYGLTKDVKWLNAASLSADYFIENDYTKHRDHWVAYSINEITKYLPEEKYFEFGLKNAQVNLDSIYNRKTSYHTYLELLMVTYELYDRIIANNIQVDYLKEFDKDELIKTINYRAFHMLNGYFYPEYAMYFQNPERILNTFFIRHDSFRIRIDDVQHFIGGYYKYYEYYDALNN